MKNKYIFYGLTACAVALPLSAAAQNVEEIDCSLAANRSNAACQRKADEEIVVTGSFLKRSKENFSSPVEIITNVDIQNAGNASLGQYIRDLTFTTNTDTVANVLDVVDGQQDSNSARFNLRGLGTDSTLTMYNGQRVLDSGNVGGIVPNIALERIDVVLDGGSSLYGSDAVAGVVNLISTRDYEGLKFNTFSNGADGFEEHRLEMLAGRDFGGGLHIVGALEFGKKTGLDVSERPEYLAAYNDSTRAGNPGTWLNSTSFFGSAYIDPSCGVFNGNNTDSRELGAYPSGYLIGYAGGTYNNNPLSPTYGRVSNPSRPGGFDNSARCASEWAQFQDVNRGNENKKLWINLNYEVNESLEFNLETNISRRKSDFKRSLAGIFGRTVTVPGNHPDNPWAGPFGRRYSASGGWRPFRQSGTVPSFASGGSFKQPYYYDTDSYTFEANYDIAGSWEGQTTVSYQKSNNEVDSHDLSFSRIQAALIGLGGPNCAFDTSALVGLDQSAFNTGPTGSPDPSVTAAILAGMPGTGGCEYFNPFGSSDPRSPFFQAGVTENSQELVDWLWVKQRYENSAETLKSFHTHISGDLFELPAGPVGMAFGLERREQNTLDNSSNLAYLGDLYDAIDGTPRVDAKYDQTVNAAFVEFAIPITNQLSMDLSGRYEDYKEVDLSTKAPKVGLRYEVNDSITLRTSYAENFVVPRGNQFAPVGNVCSGFIFGSDPLEDGVTSTGGYDNNPSGGDTLSCQTGNPFLKEQESTIKNFGISLRPMDNLSIDLDYQILDYTDRLTRLTSTDIVNEDAALFADALAAGQLSDLVSNPGAGDPVGAINAADWANSGLGSPFVVRNTTNGGVIEIRTPWVNAEGQSVESFDFKITNGMELFGGYFSQRLDVTAYKKWEYTDIDGNSASAIGKRNGDTALAAPLPRYKGNLNLSWVGDNQRMSLSFEYIDNIKFDGAVQLLNNGTTYYEVLDGATPTNIAAGDMPSYTVVNARYGRDFDNLLGGVVNVSVGVNNLTDKMPKALPVRGGFESRLYDNFGRQVYLELSYEPSF